MGKEAFRENLKKINIEVSDVQIEAFDEYYRMLVEWN